MSHPGGKSIKGDLKLVLDIMICRRKTNNYRDCTNIKQVSASIDIFRKKLEKKLIKLSIN